MSTVTVRAAGLLFDMDGVLVSSLASVRRSWRQWAHEFGVANADELEIPHGVRAVEIIRLLAPDADVAQGLSRINAIESADTADIVVLQGVPKLLESLPRERWAIVTSATGELLRARLQAAHLPMPERLVTADDVSKGKPDPEPYRTGAAKLGVPAGECVVVEDAPEGVRAGKAAGARVLGVAGTVSADELRAAGAEWVVVSLKDVKAQADAQGLVLKIGATR